MSQSIRELIEKIKEEGVQKAKSEAGDIEMQARKRAEEIIDKAHEEANHIVAEAKAQTMKMKSSAETAIQQSSRDALLSLRKEIERQLQNIIGSQLQETLSSKELGEIIINFVKTYAGKNPVDGGIQVYLNQKDADKLKKGFISQLKDLVKQPIELRTSDDINAGFAISFDGGKSSFEFSDESLAEFIGGFLNPEIAALVKKSVT